MSEFSQVERLSKKHKLKDFDCSNSPLNEYLKKYAMQNQNKNISNTFVVIKDEKVVGYYTLVFGAVCKSQLPNDLNQHLPNYQIPVMILARFAVDTKEQGQGLGKALLKNAILKTIQASEIAGINAIMVDAKNKKVKSFYENYGFVESNIAELNLFLPINNLKCLI